MANDRHPHDSRYGGGASSRGHGHGHSGSKHSRKHRIPDPPLPQQAAPPTSSRRAPTSAAGGPVLDLDPEAMPAKQGLNEWGAFTGGGCSGATGASAGSTFGFGPLLFHAGGERQDGEGTSPSPSPAQGKKMDTEMMDDAFEMNRVLLNDPISFNPMQAISWARLDEEPVGETTKTSRSAPVADGGRGGGSGRSSRPGLRGSTSTASTRSRHGSRDNLRNHQAAAQTCSVPTSLEPRSSHYASYAPGRGAEHVEPGASSVGAMSQTLSSVRLQTPGASDGRSGFVPPAPAHVPSPGSSSSQAAAGPSPGQRQQRKHRHRHGTNTNTNTNTKSSPHGGPSPAQHEVFQQQAYPHPPPPPPSSYPPSTGCVMIPTQHMLPLAHHQVRPETITTTAAAYLPTSAPYNRHHHHHHHHHPATGALPQPPPPPPPPPPRYPNLGQADLFLCLGPYCSARFQSEHELNTHYRAEHSLACSWASCGAAGFTSNNALVWHFKAEHLLLCPVPGCCDRVFANRKALEGHVRVN